MIFIVQHRLMASWHIFKVNTDKNDKKLLNIFNMQHIYLDIIGELYKEIYDKPISNIFLTLVSIKTWCEERIHTYGAMKKLNPS